MATIGIIGWGFVGQATGKGFATNKKNKIFWYDKYKKSSDTLDKVLKESEFIFICLPTPMLRDYSGMDMSIVKEVINDIAPKIKGAKKTIVIKSTVLPGTTKGLADKYPEVDFAMNPEFLTQKNAEKDFLNPSRTIIGAKDKNVARKIKRLYQSILSKDQQYFLTDTTSAEISKYMSNLMLASKIILANEFYFLAKKMKVNYDDIRRMVEVDSRIGTFLEVPGWDGDFGFGQACFPKDMIGLLGFAREKNLDMSVLSAVWEQNLKVRKNRDWEEKENAFGRGAGKVDQRSKKSRKSSKSRTGKEKR